MIDEKALRAAFAVNHHPESEPSETELAKLRAAITAYLQALSPGSTGETEGWVLVPKEPTEEQIEAMADAYRTTRRPAVCGMTIDAQFRAEFAPWFAAYRAMLSAAGERV